MEKPQSPNSIERLALYRRTLQSMLTSEQIFSHQLADTVGVSSSIVRRDLMVLGLKGSPRHGHNRSQLLEALDGFFQDQGPIPVSIVGLGHIGRSLVRYFSSNQTRFHIKAGFDHDINKVDNKIEECYSYPLSTFPHVVENEGITVGIIAVPAESAQDVANLMVENNIVSILNFAPIRLTVPENIYVENMDITIKLEKALYLSKEFLNNN